MATVFISEHEDTNGSTMTGVIGAAALTAHVVSVTATASLSAAFNTSARLIRVHADTACCVTFGTAPVATSTSPRMAGGQTEYRFVPANTVTTWRLSVITSS